MNGARFQFSAFQYDVSASMRTFARAVKTLQVYVHRPYAYRATARKGNFRPAVFREERPATIKLARILFIRS